MIKTRELWLVVSIIAVGMCFSGCDNDKFHQTGDMADFNPGAAIMDGTMQSEGITQNLVYEGKGEATRHNCPHQAKVKLTIAPDSNFVLEVTTPTVTNNCQPGGDYETAKISGDVKMNGDEMYFKKCNVNPFPPEGLGNYNLLKASGGVACFDKDFDGNPNKWLKLDFEVERVQSPTGN